MIGRKLVRFYWLLRYHRLSQFAARAGRIVRHRWAAKFPSKQKGLAASFVFRPDAKDFLGRLHDRRVGLWPHRQDPLMLRALSEGTFSFLNQSIDLRIPSPRLRSKASDTEIAEGLDWRINWQPDAPRLWRFHLHYHESLLELAAVLSPNVAWDIVADWLGDPTNSDPLSDPDAWHPFCISQRLPVWLMLAARYDVPDDISLNFFESVTRQVMWLYRNLEWDLGGNHLLENLRALIIAQASLNCAHELDWARTRQWIQTEIDLQILDSGEHFERTPTYHAIMLLAVEEICDAERFMTGESKINSIAERMSVFLSSILHPDGHIPLLGDSVFEETPLPKKLIGFDQSSFTDAAESFLPNATDYWTWRSTDRQDFLLFDIGAVACDHLPAHGHADLFSLEASIASQRFIVDCGTLDYEDSVERQFARSTKAHNTLTVNNTDHCDLWSRFRMGRRGHVLWKRTGRRTDENRAFSWCVAAHDAYKHLGIPQTVRAVLVSELVTPLTAETSSGTVWAIIDWIVGSRTHELTSRLRIHPDWDCSLETSARVVCRNSGLGKQVEVQSIDGVKLYCAEAPYFPNFGERSHVTEIVTSRTASARDPIVMLVGRDAARHQIDVTINDDGLFVCQAVNGCVSVCEISIPG